MSVERPPSGDSGYDLRLQPAKKRSHPLPSGGLVSVERPPSGDSGYDLRLQPA